jgi:hypothetical protein
VSAEALKTRYEDLKESAKKDLKSSAVSTAIAELCELSLDFIKATSDFAPLISGVPGKTYSMAKLKGSPRSSRPINSALFDPGIGSADLAALAAGNTSANTEDRLAQLLYTAAMSFCVAVDLSGGDGQQYPNQKSPGTFFEIFVGHLAALKLDVNPAKKVIVPTSDGSEADNTLHASN